MSALALGQATPAVADLVPPPSGGGICTASTFAGGSSESAAIAGGRLLAWGVVTGLQPLPTPVTTQTGLTSVSDVYLGPQTAYAVDGQGNVWGWGLNEFFTLGRQTPQFTTSPVRINGPSNVIAVAGSESFALAVTSNGGLWGWGFTGLGQLNVVRPLPQITPELIGGIGPVAKVAAGGFSVDDTYALILLGDGTVLGGGVNNGGELGLGSVGFTTYTPIPGLSDIVDIAAAQAGGAALLLAADQSGRVFVSGSNLYGELGNGTTSFIPQRTVVPVPGLSDVVAVSAGSRHALALRGDGTVMAWGDNTDGQLGNGSVGGVNATPQPVQFPLANTHIVAIAAGAFHSLALDDRGVLWTWGDNTFNTIGVANQGAAVAQPVQVAIAKVLAPCVPTQRSYIPSRDGYGFGNSDPFPALPYDQMRAYYPASVDKMYLSDGGHTRVGDLFYSTLFKGTFTDGLCYGLATSDVFLFNRSSIHPETFSRWSGFDVPLQPDTLAPPLITTDLSVRDFVDRFHARQLAALGAASSVAVWTQYGFDTGQTNDRVRGNLDAFTAIAARVKVAPEVVAFGPSPFIYTGGPAIDPKLNIPIPPPDPNRFVNLYNSSHAVVAYATEVAADGTRVIKVYDPSSVTFGSETVTDQSRIEMAPDGSVKLVDFANGADPNTGGPTTWLGGGVDSSGHDLGNPDDWILMPLPDVAFSDNGNVGGQDNNHWLVPDLAAMLIDSFNGVRILPPGVPIFRISGVATDELAMQLASGTGYDDVLTAKAPGASSSLTANGHLATVTQTGANAAGSSHHLVIDPAATSITLNAASQAEIFNLEIAADYLPAYSRDISLTGVPLALSQSLNVASDAQTSGLSITSSAATAATVPATFEQDGANAGKTTVQVLVPANSLPANVTVFDWNALPTSLIFEVIDAQGTPTGVILQGNPEQLAAQVSTDLTSLQATIAGISDQGLRDSLAAKVAAAQDSFARGQDKAAANVIDALRHEIGAQDGKALGSATATKLRSLSAEALVLLEA